MGAGSLAFLSACVPGPVPFSPAIAGTVTDARTHRPLAAARVSVYDPWEDHRYANALAGGDSDAQGRFALAEKDKPGFVCFLGDPALHTLIVHVSKPGYKLFSTEGQFCPDIRARKDIHLDAALIPDSKSRRP